MPDKKEMMTKEEAFRQVNSMITRSALIHYAFTNTLVDELGEKKGKLWPKRRLNSTGRRWESWQRNERWLWVFP